MQKSTGEDTPSTSVEAHERNDEPRHRRSSDDVDQINFYPSTTDSGYDSSKNSSLSAVAQPSSESDSNTQPTPFNSTQQLTPVHIIAQAIPAPMQTGNENFPLQNDRPPDGGWLAWLHVFAGFLVIMNAQGLNQSYGLFQAYYESVLLRTESSAKIAWIGSIQIFLLFAASILVSPLMARGLFHTCFNGGALLLFLCVLGTSFCTEWWHFVLVQGVLTGLGMGLVYGAGVLILMSYFSKNLGVATGITACGGSVGGMIFPAVAEQLVFKIGFPWTMRVFSLIALCTLVPANIIVRQRPGWKSNKKPEMDWAMFRDLPFLLMTAGFFFTFWGIYFGFYFIPTYAQSTLHLPPHKATTLLILLNALNLPGRLLPSILSDRLLGPLNTLIPFSLLTSLSLYSWIATTTPPSLTAIACLFGLFSGGVQGLYNPVIFAFAKGKIGKSSVGVDEEGNVQGSEAGKVNSRVAVVFAGIGVACLTGAPLGARLVEGGWVRAQVFAATTVGAGGVLLVAARWAREGWGVVKV